ncbi:hypothetical protein GN958_ATG20475 [Phytophthora infestans]|uniref:Uncharacterized protein n=1 Tax=Phytophthora infestans TaxID=4787 RepID=A0A8S9TP92_PHYIN|nr:hypothetical protein GN958_ATG20475 [Phytophthora infestans]
MRIVFNNLSFRLREYEEARLLNELFTDERYRTTINAQAVTHSMVMLKRAQSDSANQIQVLLTLFKSRQQTLFIFETQLLLHPKLKNPDSVLSPVIRLCNQQLIIDPANPEKRLQEDEVSRMVTFVKTILDRLKSLILSAVLAPEVEWTPAPAANETPVIFSEDLMDFFEPNEAAPQTASRDVQEARVEEELKRWISEPVTMTTDDKNGTEHILTF